MPQGGGSAWCVVCVVCAVCSVCQCVSDGNMQVMVLCHRVVWVRGVWCV